MVSYLPLLLKPSSSPSFRCHLEAEANSICGIRAQQLLSFTQISAGIEPQREGESEGDNVESHSQSSYLCTLQCECIMRTRGGLESWSRATPKTQRHTRTGRGGGSGCLQGGTAVG